TSIAIPSDSRTFASSGSERKFSFSEPDRILTVIRAAEFWVAIWSLRSCTEKFMATATPIKRRIASAGPMALRAFIPLSDREVWIRPMVPCFSVGAVYDRGFRGIHEMKAVQNSCVSEVSDAKPNPLLFKEGWLRH